MVRLLATPINMLNLHSGDTLGSDRQEADETYSLSIKSVAAIAAAQPSLDSIAR